MTDDERTEIERLADVAAADDPDPSDEVLTRLRVLLASNGDPQHRAA